MGALRFRASLLARSLRAVRAALAACLLAASCCALAQAGPETADRIAVRYLPGMVPPDQLETMSVQFQRYPGVGPAVAGAERDRFFDQVEAVIAKHGIASDWQYVLPDGAFIEILIEIGGRSLKLASAHTLFERGGRLAATEAGVVALEGRDLKQVMAGQSAAFRSRRLAFEEILALVAARVRENLAQ